MLSVPLIGLVGGAIVAGAGLATLMVAPPPYEIPVGVIAGASFIASLLSLIGIVATDPRVDLALLGALLGISAFGVGFSSAAQMVRFLQDRSSSGRSAGPWDTAPVTEHDNDAAAIILSCAEPETYTPSSVIDDIDLLAEIGIPIPGMTGRPMLFAAEKTRYRAVGGRSPARATVRALTESVRDRLSMDSTKLTVAEAYCSGPDSLNRVVDRLKESGVRRIAVVRFSIAKSPAMDRAEMALPRDPEISLDYGPSLWTALPLAESIVSRTMRSGADTDPASLGVALIGEGRPEQWLDANPDAHEHETFFMQRIRSLLVEHGVTKEHVRVGWLSWQAPDIIETVRHLAAVDCQRVVLVPATFPYDELATLIEFKHAVKLARVDADVEVIRLGGWGNEDAISKIVCEQIREMLRQEKL